MKRIASASLAAAAVVVLALTASADGTYQALPYSQDWSNTSMITVNNDWSGVPGWVGYRGDDLTLVTGTDPQTILVDGSSTPVNVTAQGNPSTFISGGVLEADGIADPVVAFQGSGTADAPHLVLHLNTSGYSSITVSYNLRDVDGAMDNSVQQVALQYRVGNSGDFTNVPSAYVSDASSGPSLATLVTPVSVILPAAVDNQSQVQLRFMTTNAVGNDEHVGPDDVSVTGTATVAVEHKQWSTIKSLYN